LSIAYGLALRGVMANINLLPYEEQRREKSATLMALWFACLVGHLRMFIDGKTEHQENRNATFNQKIKCLITGRLKKLKI
jgi:Tfp pilus assembly protein PilN